MTNCFKNLKHKYKKTKLRKRIDEQTNKLKLN